MRRVPAWVVAWLLLGAVFVAALALPPVRLPADHLGWRRFRTPEITRDVTISQTFRMKADGFQAVEFAAASSGRPVSGRLRLEITEERSGVVRRVEVRAAEVLSVPVYRFEFPPIRESRDVVYHLDLLSADDSPSTGVAVWATKGERYAGGTLLVNDRDRWADLAFATFAPSGLSSWNRLVSLASTAPGVAGSGLILAALTLYWLVAGFVLHLHNTQGTSRAIQQEP